MVRISRRTRTTNPCEWIGVALIFTIIGITGTLTFFSQMNEYVEGEIQIQVSNGVAAISASRILNSGKAYLIYGTAWKEENTAHLVHEAVRHGFRFIDTACQPKHYNEVGVGEGVVAAMTELGLKRSDLWLQTKYTPFSGQDPNKLPYDADASLEDQVLQSMNVSLMNLRTTYVDSLILHSPLKSMEETIRVWRVFEQLVDDGKALKIGISNCYDIHKLLQLYDEARIKPSFLQNRFYETSGFDIPLREFCNENGILYQSFWTLTANRHALQKEEIAEIAAGKGLSPQTLMYAFMMTMGHTPLDGTTSRAHMAEDVAVMERIQSGEKILNGSDMDEIAYLLGLIDE